MLVTVLHMQSLKNLCNKAVSVELRTDIKISCALLVGWGDSSKVTCCSHSPDLFIAIF